MKDKTPHIAIIGAGLAGSVLSNRLTEAGFLVSVYDKSRGTGGRLSSARLNDTSADLGAPFFDMADPEFQTWLAAQPKARLWQPKHVSLSNKALTKPSVYVIEPRQSALTRSLMEGSSFISQCRVGYIWPEKEDGEEQIILRDEQGKGLGSFDAAIVATPAPQAAPLLEAVPRFAKRAEEIEPTINWVAVLQINAHTSTAELITGEHPVFSRCIKDSAKPGRSASDRSEVWFIEANTSWSTANKDSDSEAVFDCLKSSLFDLLNIDAEVISYRCHRWLYSRNASIDEGFLWDAAQRLGAAGDWLQGEGSSGAWRSANLLADQLIKDLQ